LSEKISGNIWEVDSEQRKVLHLAGVFACNFPNYMYTIAEQILKESNLDFNIIKPLIKETAEKVQDMSPERSQTGPAKRNDKDVMEKHNQMLNKYPEYKDIYQLISKEIIKTRNQ